MKLIVMRNSIILVIFSTILLMFHGFGQSPSKPSSKEITWLKFEEAYRLNKKKPKKIFIDVYTDWCGWCKKMDAETFSNPVIASYMMKNFYCVKLDAERKDTVVIEGTTFINTNPSNRRNTHQLANELLRGQMSYPSYVFLNEKGQLINVTPGYQSPVNFEPILHFFGDDEYQKLKWEEYKPTFKSSLK